MNYFLRIIGDDLNHFPLYPAAFTLGSSDHDDLFLNQGAVLSNHLKVIFASGTLSLQSAQGAVYLDGKKVSAFPKEVAPGQVITLGDTHLYYGEQDCEEPAKPTMELEPGQKAPKNYRKHLANALAVCALIVTDIAIVTVLLLSFASEKVPAQEAPTQKKVVSEQFFKEVLGENLFSVQYENGIWQIKAITNPLQERQEDDLESVPNLDLEWLDWQFITFHVKQDLASLKSKGLLLSGTAPHFLVTGVALEKDMGAINEALAAARANNPAIKINSAIRTINPNFTIVSVSVSNRSAQATLRRGKEVITVAEGGRVFDIWTLKIISQQGLLINTGSADIFIAWRSS